MSLAQIIARIKQVRDENRQRHIAIQEEALTENNPE